MNVRRLIFGFSILCIVIGLPTACLAPGGWFSDWTPSAWKTSGLEGDFNRLLVRIGFSKGAAVPFIGLSSALLGGVGLVIAWAIPPARKQ